MLSKSISMCDRDLRPDLYGNVVLGGGTTMIKGFSERVRRELEGTVDRTVDGPVNISVVPDSNGTEKGYNSQRKIGAWIGGSILASLETFGKISVSKQDYEDSGSANIVHRRTVT